VAAVGEDVTEWAEDDPVCALVSGGGYAEYCAVPAPQCLPVPAGLDLVQAAALPEAVFTVWTNVFERGRLATGETLLVHGGASGIGTTAIQVARAWGARVLATAGTPEKCAACERLGAERAIDYKKEDFVAAVKQATEGRGVDVILDMVGGDYLPRNLAALALEGRLAQIAHLRGARVELNLATLMQRRLTVTGSTLRVRSVEEKGRLAQAVKANVWPLIEAGAVRPVVHATFPLDQASEAHRLMESDAHIGKIVLVVGSAG
jgi:putative PIG3 family NAD(P)H quinone oxidoreductase